MLRIAILSVLVVSVYGGRFLKKPMLDGRIVGGEEISLNEVPFQASLQSYGKHKCGGSLISKDYVLTAAHCGIIDSVRINSSQHNSGGLVVNVNSSITHEQYSPSTLDYDFMILKLERPIEIVTKYAVLQNQDEGVDDGRELYVTGWGKTLNPAESSERLRGVVVPKINQEDCSNAYSQNGGVTNQMICAGYFEGGKDACQGDSGGPLIDRETRKFVGIVSWGNGCAEANYPGVYGRVASVRNWIESITGV